MTEPTPQVLQTYALLQIAAEAFLGRRPNASQTDPFVLEFDKQALQDGNGQARANKTLGGAITPAD